MWLSKKRSRMFGDVGLRVCRYRCFSCKNFWRWFSNCNRSVFMVSFCFYYRCYVSLATSRTAMREWRARQSNASRILRWQCERSRRPPIRPTRRPPIRPTQLWAVFLILWFVFDCFVSKNSNLQGQVTNGPGGTTTTAAAVTDSNGRTIVNKITVLFNKINNNIFFSDNSNVRRK